MAGEEIVLSGKIESAGGICRVRLEDGQTFLLPRCPQIIHQESFKVVVLPESDYQTDKRQLARHLLDEILNGST
jgi:hypothetical protein